MFLSFTDDDPTEIHDFYCDWIEITVKYVIVFMYVF